MSVCDKVSISWKSLPCVNASTLWDFSWLATGLQIFLNASLGLLFSPTPKYLQPFAFLQQSHFLPRLAGLTVLTGYDRHIRGRHRLKTSKKKVVWRNTPLTQILQKLHLSSHRFVTQSGQKYHHRWRWRYTLLTLFTFFYTFYSVYINSESSIITLMMCWNCFTLLKQ